MNSNGVIRKPKTSRRLVAAQWHCPHSYAENHATASVSLRGLIKAGANV